MPRMYGCVSNDTFDGFDKEDTGFRASKLIPDHANIRESIVQGRDG